MEVKPGYKQSEVGVIPEEWEVKRLGDLGKVVRGGSPRPAGDARYFNGDFIPWLTVGSLTNIPIHQLFITDTATKLTKEGSLLSRTLKDRTLVIVNSGAKTLGVSKVLAITCCANDGIAALISQSAGEQRFLCFFLNSQIRRLREVVAAGNDQLNLNTGRIALIAVPFPTEPEQLAIATALSDVDGLLDGLDRFIAKKRDLKLAAMQQLLTGQIRLPGFSGEWETLTAREIGVFRGGNGFPLDAQGESSGNYPFFKVSDMNNEGNETIMTSANHWILETTRKRLGAAAFPKDSIVFAKVGAAVFLERKKILGQASCIDNNMAAFVLDRSRANVRFVHTLLLSKKLGALVATTALPALNGKQLGGMVLTLPPLPEQTAIAEVLTEMDAELAGLEKRREKTRALKQAMMQELLTGRIRLV